MRKQKRAVVWHKFIAIVVTSCAILSSASAAEGTSQEEARAILESTGVKGGLVVHLGCGDGKLTTALRADESCVVHGLDRDADNVAAARDHIRSAGLCGSVSVARLNGNRLPYIDNLVNVVVASGECEVASEEIARVLAPGGVAVRLDPETRNLKRGTFFRKPWPTQIDEWTHYLHGPDNNAVAHDALVSSPFHVQWVGGPKWARHHNHLSSTSAMVSSGGRLFSIVDEGPIASLALPPKWRLVARDAFNGVVLWKKQVGPWEGRFRAFRSGPTELARRLVAVGDRVYVTLGYNKPVTVLDAATGKVVRTYADTKDAVEMIHDGAVLYVVAGTIDPQKYAESRRRGGPSPAPRGKRIVAIEADTGKVIWKKSDTDTDELLPATLCVSGGYAYFQSTSHVVRLDANSGQVSWKAPRPVRVDRVAWSAPTLVVHDDVVLSADCAAPETEGHPSGEGVQIKWTVTARPKRNDASMGELIAFSTKDGSELWRCPTAQGYNAPADVLVADGLVWASYAPGRNTTDFTEGRDLHTGEAKRQLKTDAAFTETHHHRCYRNKATDRFILLGRTGVEWIDLTGAKPVRHCWVRGACQYGVMPANGLLYAPPHACACYIQSKLSGFWALAPRRESKSQNVEESKSRLEHGPAYGNIPHPASRIPHPDSWPTYRHDPGRTSRSESSVPAKLQRAWETNVGGRLSGIVVAEGKLLVAAIDTRTIHALDADNGKQLWQYNVGGRVDSPPTICTFVVPPSGGSGGKARPIQEPPKGGTTNSLAVFGCADGFVYCLRLEDGALVWRFRAAPIDQRTVAFGQVESLWPVTGSVLVRDGVVWCTAGRSSFFDGGMCLCRLDLMTGRLLGQTRFDSRDPKTGEQPEAIIEDVELPGALPDVLVDDGDYVYLRDKVLDAHGVEQKSYVPHLYSSAGLLDDAWWHRTYWLWGERTWGRASGWAVMPGFRPSGRILVTDQATVFGYGRKRVSGNSLQGYHLFRSDKQVQPIEKKIRNNNLALSKYQRPARVKYHWTREVPLVVRAMLLAGDVVFAAGPVMTQPGIGGDEPTFDANSPAVLMAFGAEDGQDLSRCELSTQPVFDGMAAAYGRLYLAGTDGSVHCYGSSQR